MIPVDLITGFLGAGKTTFLLRYARALMAQGLRLGVLVYDHGAVNVDLPLLGELRGEQCELETLAGGCGPDCHRRRFRTRLIAMAMGGYDRVLIEPSGVFDMDEFFDTLNEPPLDKWYEPGSVLAIVDAQLPPPASREEEFFLASQTACAGRVLLSRTQLVTPVRTEATVAMMRQAQEAIHAPLTPDTAIETRDWAAFTPADYAALMHSGCHLPDYVKTVAGAGTDFQSLSYLDLPLSGDSLREKVETLLHDPACGRVLRVKGFFPEGGQWFQLNATARDTLVRPTPPTRAALTVIGANLSEDTVTLLLTGKPVEHRIL